MDADMTAELAELEKDLKSVREEDNQTDENKAYRSGWHKHTKSLCFISP